MKRILPLLAAALLLIACSACVAPAPTPAVAVGLASATATPVVTAAAPTVTIQPTAAATRVPTVTPGATASVQPTAQPHRVADAATPTIRPTSTPTEQLAFRPTVQPQSTSLSPRTSLQLAAARSHQLVGDCSTARRELADLLAGKPTAAEASEARFRMAQCYLRDDAPDEALGTLSELLTAAAENDPYRAPATFLQGETLAGLGRWRDAEAAYLAYLPAAPEVAYLTWQRIGAARRALDDLPGAVAAYQSALKTSPDWTNTVAIRRALADLALQQNSPREAVAQYDTCAARKRPANGLPRCNIWPERRWRKARWPRSCRGRPPPRSRRRALRRPSLPRRRRPSTRCRRSSTPRRGWRAAVEADITSPYRALSHRRLLDSGAVVDEYQRGLANYHKGNYELAIAAFDRLLAAEPGGRDGAARYYTGLSYLGLDELDRGIAELDAFIAKHPDSPLWADAWMAKGRALAKVDRDAEAIAAYRRLAELRPDAPQAPKALWQAAILAGQPGPQPSAAAAEAYLALARKYPKADEGWRAYQNAGLTYFKLGDWRRAAETWREMAENANLPAFTRPVAYFWLGRAQAAAGDRAAALRSWQTARASGPESFYGLRADAWASGKEDQWEGGAAPPAAQPEADATEIAAWLRTWAGAAAWSCRRRSRPTPIGSAARRCWRWDCGHRPWLTGGGSRSATRRTRGRRRRWRSHSATRARTGFRC